MKTYYICAATIFILAYAIFHFGFRTGGETQLYRINDRIAFEVATDYDQTYGNGVYIRGYKKTNPLIRLLCGACSVDYDETDMPQANYIKGDYVYSGVPQHKTAKTDIVNLRTGETLNVDIPGNAENPIDLQTLPEYRERGLVAGEQYKLKQDYVKANFELLSTYTSRCLWIHLAFGILALFLIFPRLLLFVLEMIASAFDPNNPTNYLNPR